MPEELRQEVSEQNRIRLEKLRALQAEGRDPYRLTRYDQTHRSKEILDNFEALDGQTVSIAGRMMSRRVMGKASFAHVLDRDGQIQIYVRRDDVGEEAYKQFKDFDLGDVIGVEGRRFPHEDGRGQRPRAEGHAAHQVPASPAGEVPRPQGHGHTLSPALPRHDRQPRGARYVRQALADHQGHPRVHGRSRLPRGRYPRARHAGDRRGGPALRHPPQRAGY